MNDTPWQRDEPESPPESPCVKICVLDRQSGLCIGCLRSGDEIAAWPRMSAKARRALLAELPGRRAAAKPRRRGGRKARVGES